MWLLSLLALALLLPFASLDAKVTLGVDRLFEEGLDKAWIKQKRIGLITNHTAVNGDLILTADLFLHHGYELSALFAPEHGLQGDQYAEEAIADSTYMGIPVYSLHGQHRAPTPQMLKNVDVLVFDMQDIGARAYTYISTLFGCLEAASKQKIPFIVLDRPNPLGGLIVDGSLVEPEWRSFLGCASIPYCHGMTTAELAQFFNAEYGFGVDLKVVAMKGWHRSMTFKETELSWVPTSPHIPEADTPFFFATTGLLGELGILSIGIGYTLPFKVIGSPWIDAVQFAKKLNDQRLPGVSFRPFYFRPLFSKFKNQRCEGVLICILDPQCYLPLTTQYAIFGVIKALYPAKFQEGISQIVSSKTKRETFNKLNGTAAILDSLQHERYFVWKIRERFQSEREHFLAKRKKYLIPTYL